MNSIKEAYESIKKFNKISGVLDNPTLETVDLYNSLSFEELSESITAFETQDAVEVLDGALDEFYVICGKLQILEALGMNIEEGLKRVCENNLSKFLSVSGEVWPLEMGKFYNPEHKVMVLKDKQGKIIKPFGFTPVDLTDLVPQGFFTKQ
jgi:hypothetical protein